MSIEKFEVSLNILDDKPLQLDVKIGSILFVVGANGTGKSTLMQHFVHFNPGNTKRILAHRHMSFVNNSMDMSYVQKRSVETQIKQYDSAIDSRWRLSYSNERTSLTIFELISTENERARQITNALDTNHLELAKHVSSKPSPIATINEIFSLSSIPIVIRLEPDEQLVASKNHGPSYSIAELSDGERNALLICADVLTSPPNTLIILDEPERHLHRSIISPLLTTLFKKKSDCAFVVSTHDITLPLDYSSSSILLLRGCVWAGKNVVNWDANFLKETDYIPNEIKKEILGSKRNILFVEGTYESLDRQIYQLIYPDLTVIPLGDCKQVEKAVDGIRETGTLHWLNAFGLIDSDGRSAEQITNLHSKGIAALDCYSVESLYYHTDIIKKIASRYSAMTGGNAQELYDKACKSIIANIMPHKERLCMKVCEKRIRDNIMSKLPKHKDFSDSPNFEIKLDLKSYVDEETKKFDDYISANNYDGLVARYPIRESPVLKGIASSLGMNNETYEGMVRKLIVDDETTREFFQTLLFKLTELTKE